MDTYSIVYNGLHGFGVDVTSATATQCVRGFPNYGAAQDWIKRRRTLGDALIWQESGYPAGAADSTPASASTVAGAGVMSASDRGKALARAGLRLAACLYPA